MSLFIFFYNFAPLRKDTIKFYSNMKFSCVLIGAHFCMPPSLLYVEKRNNVHANSFFLGNPFLFTTKVKYSSTVLHS